ncbi:MAG: NAD-dependent epimerase/dehydratase family protein [Cyclobacteriaceae bacterium]
MLEGKKIFISGGAGVIGSEMVDTLLSQGADLFVGDLKACPEKWSGRLNFRQGDLNYLTMGELVEFQPEYFIHLAATFERSTETYDFWYENFRHNIRLSNHLMSLVKDLKSIRSVVYASSYLIYDPELYIFSDAQCEPTTLKETDRIHPRNLTGMAKLSHEIELRFLSDFKKNEFRTCIARIFRGYGRGSRDVISRWVRTLLSNEEISVYRPDGIFDYVYSKDAAEGLIRLAAAKTEGIVNLGTGRSRKVSEIIDVLKSHFPDMKSVNVDSDIPFEASQADTTLLEKSIGWKPKYDLENSIGEIIEFESSKVAASNSAFGNILVTSSSKKIPLIQSVRKAANKLSSEVQIFGGDQNPNSLSFNYTDDKYIMPETSKDNVDHILSWCLRNNVKYIIPTRDGELNFWSDQKEYFKSNGISVMVSDSGSIQNCIDKYQFSQICEELGLPSIPTAKRISRIESKTFVVKERCGAGSENIGLNLEKFHAQKHAKKLKEAVYQPYIKGKEVSADAYVTKGGIVKGVVIRYRIFVENGESVVTETFQDSKIQEIITESIRKLNLYGHIILQAIVTPDLNVHIIECNARFGGASTLSLAAGLDSFYWFLLESNGHSVENYYFVPSKRQIRQIRAKQDLLVYGDNF